METDKKGGFVLIYRNILEHPFYTEKREFSHFEALFDIFENVNYEDKLVPIKNTVIECNRGQSVKSLETWQKRWNWQSKSRVRSFLLLLQKMNTIRYENITQTVRITVLNYDYYQNPRNTNKTQVICKQNPSETQAKSNKEYKEVKEIYKESFKKFYNSYRGKKRNIEIELKDFQKIPDWQQCIDKLFQAFQKEIEYKSKMPEQHYKNLDKWLKDGNWEQTFEDNIDSITENKIPPEIQRIPIGKKFTGKDKQVYKKEDEKYCILDDNFSTKKIRISEVCPQ